MICEVCKEKNAEIVFKTVTGNQVATKAMCMSCANAMQQDMIKMFLALGFKHDQIEQPEEIDVQHEEMPKFLCTHCGRPYSRLDDQTMAGCAYCYEAIREDMLQQNNFIESESTEQTVTDAFENKHHDDGGIKDLQLRLLEAVVREQFEEAAQLRDEIKRLAGAGEQA